MGDVDDQDWKPSLRQLAIIAAENIIEAVSAYLEMIEHVPDDRVLEAMRAEGIEASLFEMNRSVNGMASATDEVARNHFLASVEKEALQRRQTSAGPQAPSGRFAMAWFGSLFPEKLANANVLMFADAVKAWDEVNRWPKLAAIWKKVGGVSVAPDTMKVGYSKRRTRGKRADSKR